MDTLTTDTMAAGHVLTDSQAEIVADLRCVLAKANEGDEFHAHQMPGRLYGDLSTTLVAYLTSLLGDRDLALEVDGHLIDHYRPDAANVHEAVRLVMARRIESLAARNGRCTMHPAFDADYCPSCGTATRIGA